ncbi:universal stress protein [Streptomyces lateritius]|uniref:universal stress protein n=1 Tax=Streptomyces lateritius TaxID=67313 RepID=UPI001C8C591A|nr:universal stress protein [Streptomyces lateritius]MBX9427023.1 universal stress protein [Streptomyces lateritius]
MTQGIVVGLDGTDQANAAAQWAAEEAVLRGTGVHLVHVKETSPEARLPLAAREPDEPWAEDLLARTAAGLRERHPDLSVTARLLPSEPVASLVAAAEEGDLLVLGSRALSGVAGYLIGSVGMSVAGLVERPVVLVRAFDASPSQGSVVVGVDLRHPVDTVLGFAFEEAARRLARVQVVYAQQLPVYATLGPAMVPDIRLTVGPEIQRSLDDLLEPWRAKFPDLTATGRVTIGSAGQELVRTAGEAALVVVGRRTRGSTPGTHIGSVAHAVLHHSRSPVALVPHN